MLRIESLSVLQTAKVLGALCFAVGLVFSPFMVLRSLIAQTGPSLAGVGMAVLSPLVYGVLGFVVSVLVSWLYNIIAKELGGIEITFVDTQ
jgi:hypothetical protein